MQRRVQAHPLPQSSHVLGTSVQSKGLSSTNYTSTSIDGRRTPVPGQITRLYQSQTLNPTPRPKTSVPANYISTAPRPKTSVPANYITKLSASPESSDSSPMDYISSHDAFRKSSNEAGGIRWSFPQNNLPPNSEARRTPATQTQNPKVLTQERRTEGPYYSSMPVRRSMPVTPQQESRLSHLVSEISHPKKSILRTSTGPRPADQT